MAYKMKACKRCAEKRKKMKQKALEILKALKPKGK